jgi:hypothetical protein
MTRAEELHTRACLVWLWEVADEIRPGDRPEPDEQPEPDFLAEWG